MKVPGVLATLTLCGLCAFGGVVGCEREGPVERMGEEVDETVDTLRNGEESTSTKIDDAVDELRE